MSKTGSGKAASFPRDTPDSSQSDSSDGLFLLTVELLHQAYDLQGLCDALVLVLDKVGGAVEGVENRRFVNAADAAARAIEDRLVEHQAALEKLEAGRFDNRGEPKEGEAA